MTMLKFVLVQLEEFNIFQVSNTHCTMYYNPEQKGWDSEQALSYPHLQC